MINMSNDGKVSNVAKICHAHAPLLASAPLGTFGRPHEVANVRKARDSNSPCAQLHEFGAR